MREQLDTIKHLYRLSGILVHPTSLPGEYGIGDLGPEAYRFADFLRDAGQHLWQTLPLGPTGDTNCPYQCYSSFAGQPLLISPELLRDDGLLSGEDLRDKPEFPEEKVDYEEIQNRRNEIEIGANLCLSYRFAPALYRYGLSTVYLILTCATYFLKPKRFSLL